MTGPGPEYVQYMISILEKCNPKISFGGARVGVGLDIWILFFSGDEMTIKVCSVE